MVKIAAFAHFVGLLRIFATGLRLHHCVGLEVLAAALRVVRNLTHVVRLVCGDVLCVVVSRAALLVSDIYSVLFLKLVQMGCLRGNVVIAYLFAFSWWVAVVRYKLVRGDS